MKRLALAWAVLQTLTKIKESRQWKDWIIPTQRNNVWKSKVQRQAGNLVSLWASLMKISPTLVLIVQSWPSSQAIDSSYKQTVAIMCVAMPFKIHLYFTLSRQIQFNFYHVVNSLVCKLPFFVLVSCYMYKFELVLLIGCLKYCQ